MDAEAITARRLHRALSLREAVGIGVGGTIGGGIFVLVGAAAGLAGPGVLLSFVLAFGAALLISLPYAELACRYPEAGGGYAFVRAVLGRRWGFVMGWAFWGAYVFVSGYVTLGFGGYLHALTGIPPLAGALGLLATGAAVNVAGVRLSGRTQAAVVVVAIAGLLGFAAAGIGSVDPGRLTPVLPEGLGAVIGAALLAFLAFGGFDMIAAAGEEVERPERNLPLAILLTLSIVLGLYLLVTFAVLVVTSRISFAMARDGMLPAAPAAVAPRTGSPRTAVLANAALLGLVAAGGSIGLAVAVGGFLYVGHFLPPLIALAVLRRRRPEPAAFRTPLPGVVVPLAVAACAVLIASSGTRGLLGGVGWLLAGLALRGALDRGG